MNFLILEWSIFELYINAKYRHEATSRNNSAWDEVNEKPDECHEKLEIVFSPTHCAHDKHDLD